MKTVNLPASRLRKYQREEEVRRAVWKKRETAREVEIEAPQKRPIWGE